MFPSFDQERSRRAPASRLSGETRGSRAAAGASASPGSAGAAADELVDRWDVLVVEDDRVLREQLVETLTDEGYRAKGVANGHEALGVVQTAQVGVMILDLMMPVMSGWQLMQALSQLPGHAGLPTLVITAASNAHRANVRGGAPVFLKPLNLSSLLRAVQAYLGQPVP